MYGADVPGQNLVAYVQRLVEPQIHADDLGGDQVVPVVGSGPVWLGDRTQLRVHGFQSAEHARRTASCEKAAVRLRAPDRFGLNRLNPGRPSGR
jgi:hypothetical protein